MNPFLLRPVDLLFFGDGRPIGGGLAGHGARWPLPTSFNAAFHGALHEAAPSSPGPMLSGVAAPQAAKRFGSVVTAGPFPVSPAGEWFFPKPADVGRCETCGRLELTMTPAGNTADWKADSASSLPKPLRLAVAGCRPPSKDVFSFQWLQQQAYERYLRGDFTAAVGETEIAADAAIFDSEHVIGIARDRERGVQDGESIYSARYLRMGEDWRIGLIAGCPQRQIREAASEESRLLSRLFPPARPGQAPAVIAVGGQQRRCQVERLPDPNAAAPLRLPRGMTSFEAKDGICRIKWVLLSPAIWPAIAKQSNDGRIMNEHRGGWLPNWIDPETGRVLLRLVSDDERLSRRETTELRRSSGQRGGHVYSSDRNALPIHTRLVAAVIPKPIEVTGYGTGDRIGAKSMHLAVPAGAVFYFETCKPDDTAGSGEPFDPQEHAARLAAALNWHGADAAGTSIRNRRSTLLGEKGFGLGVCGKWAPPGKTS